MLLEVEGLMALFHYWQSQHHLHAYFHSRGIPRSDTGGSAMMYSPGPCNTFPLNYEQVVHHLIIFIWFYTNTTGKILV